MAHEIMEYDNMLSIRETPWHGLGVIVPDYVELEEAARLSGLTWTVRKEEVYYRRELDGLKRIKKCPGYYAIVRDDNNLPLGVVGEKYEPVQNSQMFDFMGKFLDVAGTKIETCGSLRNGELVWALAKAGTEEYLKGDPIAQYFFFKNGFTANHPVEVGFTNIRIVCNNTLQMALRSAKNCYRVRHTAAVHQSLDAISEAIAAQRQYEEAVRPIMAGLIHKQLSAAEIEKGAIEIAVQEPIDAEDMSLEELRETLTKHQTKTANLILDLHERGAGADIPGVRGTAYGLLNACTEYADHFRIFRPGERTRAEARFESILMGSAAQFKSRAFDYCQNLAKAA